MAKDLAVSQAMLWKVVAGGQAQPGQADRGVGSVAWREPKVAVLRRRQAYRHRCRSRAAHPHFRPDTPGPPGEHSEMLSGETFSLAANFYRPTRYWYELQPGEPAIRSGLQLKVRDLLLMESDPNEFPEKERLNDVICGVRVIVDGKEKLKLGQVFFEPDSEDSGPARIEVDTFDLGIDPSRITTEVRSVPFRGGLRQIETLYTRVRSKVTGKMEKVRLGQFDLQPLLPTIEYTDIVSVCVLIVRRTP